MLETHPPAMASSPCGGSHLNLDAIEQDLFDFPDRALLHALRYGADMGYSGQSKSSEWPNHKSSAEAAKQIEEQIKSELKEGIIGGGGPSWEAFGFDHFRCSPLGAVAKRGTSEVRRVDDNSFKDGINADINDMPTMRFTTVDLVAKEVVRMKREHEVVQLAKVDIRKAYRNFPVRPQDWWLLGFKWKQQYYFHRRLPFGTRSSPHWFARLSVAVCWALAALLPPHAVVYAYLDDFIVVGAPQSCAATRNILTSLLARWGLPVNKKKLTTEGTPCTALPVLGVVIDTVRMELRLDAERLKNLHAEMAEWSQRHTATKRAIQSLLGVLNFAAKCVLPGRLFLRRMIDCISGQAVHRKQVQLGAEFHRDLDWWRTNLSGWNGVSAFPPSHDVLKPHIEFATDASSSFGYGGHMGPQYFYGLWTPEEQKLGHKVIGLMELATVVFACRVFGPQRSGCRVLLHCDNKADVDMGDWSQRQEA